MKNVWPIIILGGVLCLALFLCCVQPNIESELITGEAHEFVCLGVFDGDEVVVSDNLTNDLIVDVETAEPCYIQCFLCQGDICTWSDRLRTVTEPCNGELKYFQFYMFPDLPCGAYELTIKVESDSLCEEKTIKIVY